MRYGVSRRRRSRRPLATALLAVILALVPAACTRGSGPGQAASATPSVLPSRPADQPGSATPSRPGPTGTSLPATPAVLRPGDRGPRVLDLQQRLVALGYWLGEPDGVYGAATTHAVTAFQKLTGLRRDGVAGSATRQSLAAARRPVPRTAGADAGWSLDVDLAHQVLLLVSATRVEWVFDASTGARAGTTPVGDFRVYRRVDGYDRGPLGVLYRPAYFVGGVAVHGYPNVPSYPASHGCVRVPYPAMDWLWAHGAVDPGRPVRVR